MHTIDVDAIGFIVGDIGFDIGGIDVVGIVFNADGVALSVCIYIYIYYYYFYYKYFIYCILLIKNR